MDPTPTGWEKARHWREQVVEHMSAHSLPLLAAMAYLLEQQGHEAELQKIPVERWVTAQNLQNEPVSFWKEDTYFYMLLIDKHYLSARGFSNVFDEAHALFGDMKDLRVATGRWRVDAAQVETLMTPSQQAEFQAVIGCVANLDLEQSVPHAPTVRGRRL